MYSHTSGEKRRRTKWVDGALFDERSKSCPPQTELRRNDDSAMGDATHVRAIRNEDGWAITSIDGRTSSADDIIRGPAISPSFYYLDQAKRINPDAKMFLVMRYDMVAPP